MVARELRAVDLLFDLNGETSSFPLSGAGGSTEADLDLSSPSDWESTGEFSVARVEILVVSLRDLLTESSESVTLDFLLF